METPKTSPTKTNALSVASSPISVCTIRGSPFNKSGSPTKSPRKPLSDNIWDPDDDEFPDWAGTYKSACGTFNPSEQVPIRNDDGEEALGHSNSRIVPNLDPDSLDISVQLPQSDEEIREEERRRDTIAELSDPACGNPVGSDLHDELVAENGLYRNQHPDLLSVFPVGHMHILRWEKYTNLRQQNEVVKYVRPRLCDAIATVLFETSPKCLNDFLDGLVKVFEWRHEFSQSGRQACVLVRRVGNEVISGLYRNHGFHYLWYCLVKSRIDYSGRWTEVFAACHGTTPVTDKGPVWGEFRPVEANSEASPATTDAAYALFVGRQFACYLVGEDRRLWEHRAEWGEKLEWEADGNVTDLGIRGRSALSASGEDPLEE